MHCVKKMLLMSLEVDHFLHSLVAAGSLLHSECRVLTLLYRSTRSSSSWRLPKTVRSHSVGSHLRHATGQGQNICGEH